MNEAETRAELIDPAFREAGWGVVDGSRTPREVIAPGRIMRFNRNKDDKNATARFRVHDLVGRHGPRVRGPAAYE